MYFHHLKLDKKYFDHKKLGLKPWELRLNDRGYEVGDILCLNEYDSDAKSYTNRMAWEKVIAVFADLSFVEKGYVMLSTVLLEKQPNVKGKVTDDD